MVWVGTHVDVVVAGGAEGQTAKGRVAVGAGGVVEVGPAPHPDHEEVWREGGTAHARVGRPRHEHALAGLDAAGVKRSHEQFQLRLRQAAEKLQRRALERLRHVLAGVAKPRPPRLPGSLHQGVLPGAEHEHEAGRGAARA